MEELLVYAFLLGEGLEVEEEYQIRLDNLFVNNPTDDDLLELEYLSSDLKESVIYIRTHFDYENFNQDVFGRALMQELKKCYENTELKIFARKMYLLWKNLPDNIQHVEPFFILCYADDPLSWGDEKQTRELYEKMLNYYDFEC